MNVKNEISNFNLYELNSQFDFEENGSINQQIIQNLMLTQSKIGITNISFNKEINHSNQKNLLLSKAKIAQNDDQSDYLDSIEKYLKNLSFINDNNEILNKEAVRGEENKILENDLLNYNSSLAFDSAFFLKSRFYIDVKNNENSPTLNNLDFLKNNGITSKNDVIDLSYFMQIEKILDGIDEEGDDTKNKNNPLDKKTQNIKIPKNSKKVEDKKIVKKNPVKNEKKNSKKIVKKSKCIIF